MPVRPENRSRYPADWPAISRRIRFDRAKGRCECVGECGLDHSEEGGRCSCEHGGENPRTGSTVVLTAAHRRGSAIEAVGDADLFAACQQCHNRYDSAERAAGRKKRARALIRRTADLMRFELECATGKRLA